jgi:tetratricopeptide (TPR) repeat protein
MKQGIFIFLFCFFSLFILNAQNGEERNEEWFYREAEKAISKENYEYALSLLNEGRTLFADSFRLAEKTGDLYYDKELYSLAFDAYKQAEELDPERDSIIYNLGSTLARLNKNEEAINYYERLINYDFYHKRAVDDLSWLYYKVHRLKESEELLLDEMEKSFHRNYAITLGTVYSDMYNYEKSREYYLLSIEDARNNNASYFASVALYNLSLLEYSFYNYEQSLVYTEDSLDARDRSSGHLARGEILQLAGRYREAETQFLKAESLDDTPLSRISLAGLYRRTGHFEKALAYIMDVYNRRDMSWMYFFGTDQNQYDMDIHGPLRDIYRAMSQYEKRRIPEGFTDGFVKIYDRIRYSILGFYHDQLFRKAAKTVGDNNAGKSNLNSWWAYSRAAMGNKPTFMKYIELCEEFELALTDKAVPWYMLERGRETADYDLLESALALFRPEWEVEPILDALQNLIHLEKGNRDVHRRNRLNQLYQLNSGYLIQHDLDLPLVLEVSGTITENRVEKYLKRAGFEVAGTIGEGFIHKLIVRGDEREWSWFLLDPEGEVLYEAKGEEQGISREYYRNLTMSVLDNVYVYRF